MANPTRLDTAAAAEYLGIAKATLETWRCRHEYHVPYFRVGRSVVYSVADLDAFLKAGRVEQPVKAPRVPAKPSAVTPRRRRTRRVPA